MKDMRSSFCRRGWRIGVSQKFAGFYHDYSQATADSGKKNAGATSSLLPSPEPKNKTNSSGVISMSRKNVSWSVLLVLICLTLLAVSATAQHFQQVKGTLTFVAAGRNEIFGYDTHAAVWRYHPATKSFGKIAGASLFQLAVGGGTVSQLDEVWGIDISLNVYRFNYSTKTFDQIPGVALSQIAVGEGAEDNCHPYEVWGINSAVIYRYNYCTGAFEGLTEGLTQVATGGGDVWALNRSGNVIQFELAQGIGASGNLLITLTQIAVGVDNVWGINSSNQVVRYDPNTYEFSQVEGGLVQIAVGGDGVWGINQDNYIFRFDPGIASWVQVNGILKSIAVGSGAGVWGVNSSDQVFTFVRP
jgi:hypothetical protein